MAGATPVLEKAQRRASEKNLETVISNNKGQGNDYTLLDSLSDSHLELVATDSCVIFNPRAGAKEEALSLIRAKELAQAALAEAADTHLQEQAAVAAAAREAAAEAPTPAAGDADGVATTHLDLGQAPAVEGLVDVCVQLGEVPGRGRERLSPRGLPKR